MGTDPDQALASLDRGGVCHRDWATATCACDATPTFRRFRSPVALLRNQFRVPDPSQALHLLTSTQNSLKITSFLSSPGSLSSVASVIVMRMLEGVAQGHASCQSPKLFPPLFSARSSHVVRAPQLRVSAVPKRQSLPRVCLRPLLESPSWSPSFLTPPHCRPRRPRLWSLFRLRAGATNLRKFGQRRRHHPYYGQSHKLCVPLRVVAVGGCRSRI